MTLARGKCTMLGIDGKKFESEKELEITLLNPDEEEK